MDDDLTMDALAVFDVDPMQIPIVTRAPGAPFPREQVGIISMERLPGQRTGVMTTHGFVEVDGGRGRVEYVTTHDRDPLLTQGQTAWLEGTWRQAGNGAILVLGTMS